VKLHDLIFALNATTHAFHLVESATHCFATDLWALESGSKRAVSVAHIKNLLSDALQLLMEAEAEIGSLMQNGEVDRDAPPPS
jgi:hypothetical protein